MINEILDVLQLHVNIENIVNELEKRIPEKNQLVVSDIISELETISYRLALLEKDVYINYLTNEIEKTESSVKRFEYEDLEMIYNLYKEDVKLLTPKLMEYFFETVNKMIIEKEWL